nr:MAG TPA: hypothetical protein [Caudoviricetes sp.]
MGFFWCFIFHFVYIFFQIQLLKFHFVFAWVIARAEII